MNPLTNSKHKLRGLNDPEYTEAQRLARIGGISLEVCPTCGGREEEIEGSGGVKEFVGRTYTLWGETYDCNCKEQMALRARYLLANIGEQYMRLNWDDFDGTEDARKWVATYDEKWKSFKANGYGLEFGGEQMGVGKTFAATTVGKNLIKRGQKVFFISFVEMVSAFESEDKDDLERKMRDTTYLILDEIRPSSSERQREFYANKFESLIRYRTNFNLPTIITTNLTEKQITDEYPRVYSLLAAKQVRIEMSGDDKRAGQIGIENLELILNDEVRPIT